MSDTNKGYEGLPPLSREWFLAWQDGILDGARANLAETHTLVPLVFMLTLADRVAESEKPSLVPVEEFLAGKRWGVSAAEWDAQAADKYAIAILPQSLSEEETFFAVVQFLVPPEKRPAVDAAITLGVSTGRTLADCRAGFVEVVLRRNGMHEKDLLALFIRDRLKRLGAMAYVKLDDGYSLNTSAPPGSDPDEIRQQYPASLEGCEQASEAIIAQLETPTFMRMLALPYRRTERNTGKVIGFGEPKEVLSDRVGTNPKLSGRFSWMLEAPA